MHRFRLLIVISICGSVVIPAATASAQSSQKKSGAWFSSGFVVKKDKSRHQATGLAFAPEALTFRDDRTGRELTLPLEEVDYVRAKTGSHALEGALLGGGIFLLAGLSAWVEVETDPLREPKENAGQIIALLTLGGAAVGLLIGSMFPKESTVFQKGKLIVTLAPVDRPGFPGSQRGATLVSIGLSF